MSVPTHRIALVTGANKGIGKQVAKELAAAGLTVLVGSRDLARGEKVAAEIGERATAIQLDVTDTAFDRRGRRPHTGRFRAPRSSRQQRRDLAH